MPFARRPRRALVLVLAASLTMLALSVAPVAAADPWRVVVSGLDNPRGLDFGPNGTLYVAEAGRGGNVCPAPDECAGLTSRISAVDLQTGTRRTLVDGLISLAGADGTFAIGADDVSVAGGGRIMAIIGENPEGIPPGISGTVVDAARAQLGRLIVANPAGRWRALASVGSFDYAWTQSHAALDPNNPEWPDANPYALLSTPGGTWVVDAGSNTLDRVAANGHVSVAAWFPTPAGPLSDAVPDCITAGWGGLVVGELGGRLLRFDGSLHEVPLSGAAVISIAGCAAWGGDVYVTDMFGGTVDRIDSAGHVTMLASGLDMPGGIAVGRDGSLYVTNHGTSVGIGEVIRIAR